MDMDRFPSEAHLASWAKLSPGNHESAGKRRSSKTRKGNPYVRAVLIEAGQAAGRTKGTYLAAQYHRLARRRGKYKAIVAVAHSVLVIAYHILRDRQPYTDLGADYFERLEAERVERYHVKKLRHLGYEVTLTPSQAA